MDERRSRSVVEQRWFTVATLFASADAATADDRPQRAARSDVTIELHLRVLPTLILLSQDSVDLTTAVVNQISPIPRLAHRRISHGPF